MDTRLLLIEDEAGVAALVVEAVAELGFQVEVVNDGRTGLDRALSQNFSFIVLDLGLPGIGGMEICRQLRQAGSDASIIILSARNEETDKVLGLELGADDYVSKPFSSRELVARLRALIRRSRLSKDAASPPVMRLGDLTINFERMTVSLGNEPLVLTPIEFDLLTMLASVPGRAFSREELTEQVFGGVTQSTLHTLTAHMCRLRAKLQRDPAAPKYVLTVKGIGYRLAAHDELG